MVLTEIITAEDAESASGNKAKSYLEECAGKKDAFLSSFLDGLQEPITKDTLGGKLKKDFFRSVTLRMSVGGREMLIEK